MSVTPDERPERLAQLLPAAGVDVLLVTELLNVRYLTGYTGSNGLALVGPDLRTFITDFRYVAQAEQEVAPAFERRRAAEDLFESVLEALPVASPRLGFDDGHLSVRAHRRLSGLLDGRAQLVPAGGLVERLREVKEPGEVAKIRAAAVLADAAFERVLDDGLIGRTERDVATALEQRMRDRGAQGASFDTIVAAGAHGALPHASPREVAIRDGDLVVIDWGARLDGYCSDCTRTVAAGRPRDDAREMYELVLRSQLAGLDAVRAGRSGREVDAAAREVIATAGHGDEFGHGLGHGVGLHVHEGPRLSQRSESVLAAGNVVTVEPGVYLPGRFGIRIEDLVVVGEEGREILTSISKRLLIAG